MPKRVFFDDDARAKILAGAKKIYEPVRSTLGPLGRNVVIHTQFGLPVPTHDGVTVARSIDLPTKDDDTLGEATGADLMKLASAKVNDTVGDGTTTVTVLAYHILEKANKLIAAGHNPMILKRQLDAAAASLSALLPNYVEEISDDSEKLKHVANISAGGDAALGDLIAQVMSKVGSDGSVTVEQSQGSIVSYDIVEGYQFDRGLVSPYMVTDTTRMRAIVENTPILITDTRISNVMDLIPLLEKVAAGGDKKLVIICEDMDGDALETLVKNKLNGAFLTVAVKAPAFGDRRNEMLEDMAILTGGKVVSREQGMQLTEATLDMLGTARRVVASREETVIVEGLGDPEDIAGRMEDIKQRIATADSEFNKERLEERLAAMAGKVAVIKVGGVSETEIEEKKFRVDDAVFATKAALAEGIVAGGGVTLLNMVDEFTESPDSATGSAGEQILVEAMQEPFLQLMLNSGHRADYLREEIRRSKKKGWGFSVYEPDKLIDLKKAGVIDPAKVTRETLQNAVSIAGTAITMGALVVDIPAEFPQQLPR